MIICDSCGVRNQDGARFCGACQAFLEWDGEAASSRAGAAPEPAPATGPTGSAQISPVPAQRQPETPSAGESGEAAAAPVQPVVPAPVRPDEAPRRSRLAVPVPQEETAPPAPGDVTCPGCSAGNTADRRFCRSCGARLTVPQAQNRTWWQRAVEWLRRRRAFRAGQRRPVRDYRMPRRLLWLAGLAGLVLVALLARPLMLRAADEIRDLTVKPEPIRAEAFAASSSLRDTPPRHLGDTLTNKYWAPQGQAAGAWVEASFTRPVRVLHIVAHGGVSLDQKRFTDHARPHELEVVATSKTGATTTEILVMRDQPGPQTFAFKAKDTVRIRLVVKSTFGPKGIPSVAIGELEFYGRT